MGGARPPLPECYWLAAGSGRSLIGSIPNNGQACLKRQCPRASRAAQSPTVLSFKARVCWVSTAPTPWGRGARSRSGHALPPLFCLGLLTQKAKARQSCAPSPRSSPLPALARKKGGRKEEEAAGPHDGCQRGGGEGRVLGCARPGRCPAHYPYAHPPRLGTSHHELSQRKSAEAPRRAMRA